MKPITVVAKHIMPVAGPVNSKLHIQSAPIATLTTTIHQPMSLTREQILELWEANWKGGWGYAPWSQALENLTAEQAAWKPQPQRYSILEMALHLIFWREVMARRAKGEQVSAEERERRNHESPPPTISEEAWHNVRQRFIASQQQVHDAILMAEKFDDFLHLTFHDVYHVGQIMYLRAMQNLPPVV